MASAESLAPVTEVTVVEARVGNDGDFEGRFRRHYATVYGILLRVTGSPEEAEDLAQEVFLRLHQHRGALSDDQVSAWLYRVALNAGFNAVRSRRRGLQRILRWSRLEPALTQGVAGPEDEVTARDEAARVRAALAQLRERDRSVLALRASGVSYAEIAAALGIKPGSVGTTLARAERALRERYEAMAPQSGKEHADAA